MKKFGFLFLAMFSVATLFAQTTPLNFATTKHTFGKIKQNVPATYAFSFTNTSDQPVVIESAVAGCGCTTPEYPQQPIASGKTGTIKVTYNAAAPGTFTKQVTVKVAKVADPIILNIDGEVVPAATAKATAVKTTVAKSPAKAIPAKKKTTGK